MNRPSVKLLMRLKKGQLLYLARQCGLSTAHRRLKLELAQQIAEKQDGMTDQVMRAISNSGVLSRWN